MAAATTSKKYTYIHTDVAANRFECLRYALVCDVDGNDDIETIP